MSAAATAGFICQDNSAHSQRQSMLLGPALHLLCAGDLTAERVSATASPVLSKSGTFNIPRLHLSPAPSATAADFRGMLPLHMSPVAGGAGKAHASRLSPAPSGGMKIPPLRLSPAPSGGAADSRAGSGFSLPKAFGTALQRSDEAQAPSASWRVPTLKLPGKHKGACLGSCCPCHIVLKVCRIHCLHSMHMIGQLCCVLL